MILYTDKSELFECNINVDGTSLQNTKVRLVLESNKWNLVFYGKIDNSGKCSIDIQKLNILNEGEEGQIRLEVIADESLFVPWEDSFNVKKSKKVTVEVLTKTNNNVFSENKTKITVSNAPTNKVEPKQNISVDKIVNEDGVREVTKKLQLNNITLKNFDQNAKNFEKIIQEAIQKYNINNINDRKLFRKSIIDFFAK